MHKPVLDHVSNQLESEHVAASVLMLANTIAAIMVRVTELIQDNDAVKVRLLDAANRTDIFLEMVTAPCHAGCREGE